MQRREGSHPLEDGGLLPQETTRACDLAPAFTLLCVRVTATDGRDPER
jgi:hypothetical protein